MPARVRIGRRGKEQDARVTGVASISGHGCCVGVNLTVPSGALPDVGVCFATDDPNTAILVRKLAEALDAAGVAWRADDVPCDKCGKSNDRAAFANYCSACAGEHKTRVERDPEYRPIGAPDPRRIEH